MVERVELIFVWASRNATAFFGLVRNRRVPSRQTASRLFRFVINQGSAR